MSKKVKGSTNNYHGGNMKKIKYTKSQLQKDIISLERLRHSPTFKQWKTHIQGAIIYRLGFFRRKLRELEGGK
tara:strand:- start:3374 stop:3592 length:219 start_codon:yes stop_codon:yes gene_type:complete